MQLTTEHAVTGSAAGRPWPDLVGAADAQQWPTTVVSWCERAERERSVPWPLDTVLRAWTAGLLAERARGRTVGTVATGHDVRWTATGLHGRYEVVAPTAPDSALARTADGWCLVSLAGAPAPTGVVLADPAVRRWSGDPDGWSPTGHPVDLAPGFADGFAAMRSLATAASSVGVAQAALDLAVRHAGLRRQFGQAIGTFQAVAHRLADMHCAVELARSAVLMAAAGPLVGGAPEPTAAGAAALLATTTLPAVVQQSLHLHGASGLTEDLPVHLHLRRVLVLRALHGGPRAAVGMVLPGLDALASRPPIDPPGGIR